MSTFIGEPQTVGRFAPRDGVWQSVDVDPDQRTADERDALVSELRAEITRLRGEVARLAEELRRVRRDIHEVPPHY